jgi:hypothetical protein
MHSDTYDGSSAILEVNVDITQRKVAEEALRLSNAALLRANEDLNHQSTHSRVAKADGEIYTMFHPGRLPEIPIRGDTGL